MHQQKEVELYPNPARNSFAIHHSSVKAVKVKTPTGRLVKEWPEVNHDHHRFKLPLLSAGTYFVQIQTANKEAVKQLILLP
jgi:hypothetical protein